VWVLLRRHAMPPIPLRRRDIGNDGYDNLLAARRILPVPSVAEVVVKQIDRLVEWNPAQANVVLRALWGICDPEETERQPYDSFGICLQVLVESEVKMLHISRITVIILHCELKTYIQQIYHNGWFREYDFIRCNKCT
jgi:hypothetical protein